MRSQLVLIGHGYVGEALAESFQYKQHDFSWITHRFALGARFGPGDVVVNAAGYNGTPNVDACEDHKVECKDGNVRWPLQLQEIANGATCIHIGSGCLYSGGPFDEDAEPNFSGTYYSKCKAEGQKLLAEQLGNNGYLLRIRMPFGAKHHYRNLLAKLRTYRTLMEAENSISCIDDVVKVVGWVIGCRPPAGVYNVVNPYPILTSEIARIIGIKPEEWHDMPNLRARRSICSLDTSKLEHAMQNRLPSSAERLCQIAYERRLAAK